jgi:Tfp pilus tip-associated adhesin PilY1
MAEENAKVVEETEVEEGEVVEIEPVEEAQAKTEIPREPVDEEAEAQIEDVSDTPEAKKEEELEDYSKSVQKRINTLTRKLREAENRLKSQKQQATTALKSAHEVQDYDKVAKAQEVLAKIAVEEAKVNASKVALEQEPPLQQAQPTEIQQNVQQPMPGYQPPPKLDEKQEAWVEKNQWFGEDEIMTLAAFLLIKN